MATKITVTGRQSLMKRLAAEISRRASAEADARIGPMFEDLVASTPIDTGYARSRWTLDTQLASPGLSYAIGYSPYPFNIGVKSFRITNDADYIVYLNRGWSQQAPAYFIERVILNHGFTINGPVVTSP